MASRSRTPPCWRSSASTRAKPSVVFVGRITRQKGLPYFLRAAERLPADVQVILCAGAPDTPQIMAEVEGLVRGLQETREGVVWIDRMLPRHELCTILSAATTFVCPSVYEPLGIVNLEAMACGAAVVGTATGGIPEVVVDGVTGRLVPIEQVQDGTGTPIDPERVRRRPRARADRGRQRPASAPRRTVRRAASGRRTTSAGPRIADADRRAVRGGRRHPPIG